MLSLHRRVYVRMRDVRRLVWFRAGNLFAESPIPSHPSLTADEESRVRLAPVHKLNNYLRTTHLGLISFLISALLLLQSNQSHTATLKHCTSALGTFTHSIEMA